MPKRVVVPPARPSSASHSDEGAVWVCPVVVCVISAFTDAADARSTTVVLAAGAAVVTGLLLGTFWWVARRLTNRLRPSLCIAIGGGAGVLVGWGVADALGAMAKLHGPYRQLALMVLASSVLGLCIFGALLAALQPNRVYPIGRAASWNGGRRALVGLTLLGVSLCILLIDSQLYVGLYPAAHTALRLIALLCTAQALLVGSTAWIFQPAARNLRAAALGCAAAGPILLVGTATWGSPKPSELRNGRFAPLYLDTVRYLTDLDRDGASALLEGDCDEFDARVRAGRFEIPGNGRDDNCTLGDGDPEPGRLRLVPPALATTTVKTNVVLIVVDSLRADRMSVYGYADDTTPHLRAWAREARVFDRAYTAGGWTGISLPPMTLGVWARRIWWTEYYYTLPHLRFLSVADPPPLLPGEHKKAILTLATEDPALTLAELLRRRGMQTLAVVDDGAGDVLSAEHFSRGFERYIETDTLPVSRRDDAGTVDLALAAIHQVSGDQPFFLWVHLFGVHAPSTHHPDSGPPGETESELYDHELRFADRQLGRLLDELDTLARKEPTLIVLCGDHGEHFTRNGTRQHGYDLQDGDVRIPLILRGPAIQPGRIKTPASTVDIAATILAATNTPSAGGLDGRDLRTLPEDETRIVMTDTWLYPHGAERSIDLTAALDGRFAVMRDLRTNDKWVVDHESGRSLPPDVLNPAITALDMALDRYLEQIAVQPVESNVLRLRP